ncbi:MAG: phosphonoacetaldehyde hydrolase [Anaerolineae bacterium]
MTISSSRSPLRAVIFDWAGTTVDYGCFAPVTVFVEVFGQRGVPITVEQARAPMGLAKRDHIRAIAAMPPVAEAWRTRHGRDWTEADIDAMFQDSVPLQMSVLLNHADVIPGVAEATAACRARGLKIGSTTGYSRPLMEALVPVAARNGYQPDAWLCPSDVPAGRPAPYMVYLNAIRLQAYPMAALVKVGDTVPDIEEGLNAAMWTVGVAKTGNELGLSRAEAEALPPEELRRRVQPIYERLMAAGAHYVIDSIADLLPVLDDIEGRLARGERP